MIVSGHSFVVYGIRHIWASMIDLHALGDPGKTVPGELSFMALTYVLYFAGVLGFI
jgi:hypothetical protein